MLAQKPTEQAWFLSIIEAAQALGCSHATIRRRIKDGTLPAVIIAGKWRIRTEDLSVLMERR